jgi:peptide/nickel transport system permease protein
LAGRFLQAPGAVVGLSLVLPVVVAAILANWIAPAGPFESSAIPLQSPSRGHAMGTDDLGRDLFSGIVHGARASLLIMLAVAAISSVIGLAIGAVAGIRRGLVDDFLMRTTEVFQTVPRFFLAVIVIALFGPGVDRLVLILGLTSWPMLARVVRAETLSIRQREFVEAARSLGASDWRILWRHVLPNVAPPAVVVITLTAASVILLEAALGFIGLGDPRVMSWGYLASNGQRFLRAAWWLALFPGLSILVTVLGLNLIGDAVNDLLNPLSAEGGRRRLRQNLAAAAPQA